jgi:hypothetical protein
MFVSSLFFSCLFLLRWSRSSSFTFNSLQSSPSHSSYFSSSRSLQSSSSSSSSSQSIQNPFSYPPSSSLSLPTSVSKPSLINSPKGLVNQTIEEAEYLGYHKCNDGFEAYGAAYLITSQHLILQNTNYSLDWVNCEMASFIMVSFPSFSFFFLDSPLFFPSSSFSPPSWIHLYR